MAGGGSALGGLTDSILEVPSYVLALVFLFFAAVSIIFERVVHWLRQRFIKAGRWGLVEALNSLVLELTMLGFISLLLITFQKPLEKMCVTYSPSMADWTLIDNLDGCPCCLKDTASVSLCAQIDHGCLFNLTSETPYCDCDLTAHATAPADARAVEEEAGLGIDPNVCHTFQGAEAMFVVEAFVDAMKVADVSAEEVCKAVLNGTTDTVDSVEEVPAVQDAIDGRRRRRRLLESAGGSATAEDYILPKLTQFSCEGPFLTGKCPPGKVPVMSATSFNQVHLWIFLIACFHVVTAIAFLLLTLARMRQWRRWQEEDSAAGLSEPAAEAAAGGARGEEAGSVEPAKAAAAADGDAAELGRASGAGGVVPSGEPAGMAIAGSSQMANGDGANGGGSANGGPAAEAEAPGAEGLAKASPDLITDMQKKWKRRDTFIKRKRVRAMEAFICVAQAFAPNLVTRSEFSIVRSSYIDQNRLPPDFDFVAHSVSCLERDAAAVVGISWEMWLVVILMLTAMGRFGWVGDLFLVAAAAVLLVVDIILVVLLRFACRGGHANSLRKMQWWRQPTLLKVPIRMVLFLCSLIFSSITLFAWQFGAQSCLFKTGSDMYGYTASLPYWVSIIIAGLMLFWTSLVTMPAYSLVVHTIQTDGPGEAASYSHSRQASLLQRKAAALPLEEGEEVELLRAENEQLMRVIHHL